VCIVVEMITKVAAEAACSRLHMIPHAVLANATHTPSDFMTGRGFTSSRTQSCKNGKRLASDRDTHSIRSYLMTLPTENLAGRKKAWSPWFLHARQHQSLPVLEENSIRHERRRSTGYGMASSGSSALLCFALLCFALLALIAVLQSLF